MRNEVLLKTFWYGLCEKCIISMVTPYMILENGGGGWPTNSIISRVLLILEH